MPTEPIPRKDGERKQARVTIDAEGRDKGKTFIITEMSADAIERWFRRVLAYLARMGVAAPSLSFIGVAGMTGFNPIQTAAWLDNEELNEELMACVMRLPRATAEHPSVIPRQLFWGKTGPDIEELKTLAQLKGEVLALHLNFSTAADLWSFALGLVAAVNRARTQGTMEDEQPDMQTSPTQSPSP